MKETSARLLKVLGLLQSRAEWSGEGLAGELGITTRTVRRDIDKLRELDYPIEATKGIGGGYRLGDGRRLPPLVLDDDEAVAVAIALRTASTSGVSGIGETALRALVKLDQLLPSRLRHRVSAVRPETVPGPPDEGTVDADVLALLGGACRDHQSVQFGYLARDDTLSTRSVEPHAIVTWGRRWYLVGWDRHREQWRTFRVDRVQPPVSGGPRFAPRAIPGGDAAAWVATSVGQMWPYRAIIRLHVPADSPLAEVAATYGRIEALDEGHCLFHLGAETVRALTFIIGALDTDFDIVAAPQLAAELERVSQRYQQAIRGGADAPAGAARPRADRAVAGHAGRSTT